MIPVKVNFVVDCSDSALKEYVNMSNDNAPAIFVRGDLNWCLQSFLILSKRNNIPVSCSNRLFKDCINIIHSDTLLILKGVSTHFIVCVRADYPKRLWAHYHLVQNRNQVSLKSSYVPHWVQPGLLKRNKERTDVFTVAYAGQPSNGNMAGTPDTWKRLLEPYQIRFITLSNGEWHDLTSVDVLIGIRSFDKKEYNTKPPTKLFNAWHAGIPLIAGNDSAYKQVGTPGVDYLIATSPSEALNLILALRDDKQLYCGITVNGAKKAAYYSEEKIAEWWEKVLAGPVLSRYHQWKKRQVYERLWFKIKLAMSIPEQKSKQMIKRFLKASKILGIIHN
jgi:hypothetical protein